MSQTRSLGRAALLGLGGGLALGAVALLASAVLRLSVDCTGLGTEECTFEREMAQGVARLQTFASLGLALLAAGVFLLVRRPRPPS